MTTENPFKYFKTSPKIIRLAVMYYVRYPLSFRQVEDILHERGTLIRVRLCLTTPLLDRVWESNTEIETRTVDVHIGRLRKSLKKVSNKNLIRTIRGFGYSLDNVG